MRHSLLLGLILVLAPCDATSEKLRGLREGWVHWYVGHPIVHPERPWQTYAFDEAAGRIIALHAEEAAQRAPDRE